jgi:hypothetical protein
MQMTTGFFLNNEQLAALLASHNVTTNDNVLKIFSLFKEHNFAILLILHEEFSPFFCAQKASFLSVHRGTPRGVLARNMYNL